MKIRSYFWNQQVPTDEIRVLDIEREDLKDPPLGLTPENVMNFASGRVKLEARNAEIVLFEEHVLKSRVGPKGPHAEEIRSMTGDSLSRYLRGSWSPGRQASIGVEAAAALLVNKEHAFSFRELPEPVKNLMLALRFYAQYWSTDMREWVKAGDSRNWKYEAYRLPPHIAAFAIGFMGASESGCQGWHKYLMVALATGHITDTEFNQLRQIPRLTNDAGIVSPDDDYLFFVGKEEDAPVPV